MLFDFVLSYIFVGAYMGLCWWRSENKGPFPIQGSHEWAQLIAYCIIWPKMMWDASN